MGKEFYLIAFIATAMLATVLTRAAPFLFLNRFREHPLLIYLGQFLPPVLMAILVVYAISGLPISQDKGWVAVASLFIVALAQWFTKNALVSIAIGSVVYMLVL